MRPPLENADDVAQLRGELRSCRVRETSLKGVSFIIADSNVYFSSLLFSMLKGFGADKIIQARDAQSATESLQNHQARCHAVRLHAAAKRGGMAFVRGVRLDCQRVVSENPDPVHDQRYADFHHRRPRATLAPT